MVISHFITTKEKCSTRITLHWNLSYLALSTGYPDARDDTLSVEEASVDDARIQHIKDHLAAVKAARE